MSGLALTGERLQHEDALYGADLARHRVAYRFAIDSASQGRVLDLGCGTGYGTAELSETGLRAVGLDRVVPSASARRSSARFVRADLNRIPFASGTFDLVVSFQVIEHLEDPRLYLDAIADLLRPGGVALLTTPNVLQSDRENPYHVHEYEAAELGELLRRHFGAVELRGVGATGPAARYHEERLRRIRRMTRLDPLGIRRLLPRSLVEWLFARLSVIVRLGIRGGGGIPELGPGDHPIGSADEKCLDLLAICRRSREP